MSLEECKRKRSNIKRNISRIKSNVEGIKDSNEKPCHAELQCRLGILESYFKQALSVQADIEDLDPTDSGRADLEDSYVSVKLCIQSQLGEDLNSTVHNSEPTHSSCTPTVSHLPRLSLPTFSGNYAEYKNFITSFTQIIARDPKLSNIEKFNYLLSCLKGAALETVQAFQVTSENYTKALDRLKARFDNPTLIFFEGIASLFTLQSVEKPNPQQLRSLVDKASAIYSSLESLGTSTNIVQAMLIYIVISKCDQQTCKKWNEALDYKTLLTWSHCTQVLERHCRFLHSSQSSLQRKPESGKQNRLNNPQNKNSVLFKELDTNKRFGTAKKYDVCINCLSNGHRMTQCPSKHRCRTCNRAHHTLLHHDNASQISNTTQSQVNISNTSQTPQTPWQALRTSWQAHSSSSNSVGTSQPYTQQAATHSHMEALNCGQVILATAMVLVKDSTGSFKLGRALLDSCSQVNFITDDFAKRLHLRRERHHVGIRSIGESLTNLKSRTTTTIKSRTSAFQLSLQFGITAHIAYQPDAEIDTSAWNLPANTTLADKTFYKPRRIDLLLGTEALFDALAVGQIHLGPNLPTLQKTLFGWVLSGQYQRQQNNTSSTCILSSKDSIDSNMQRLWEHETIETPVKSMQPDHQICENHFKATTRQDATGRIIVSLPFKDNYTSLGNSYDIACRRFFAIERRLLQSPDIRNQYVSFMAEYENLGHMSVVETPNLEEPHYYIPHHCVLKPSSVSTKLRVVFDASCRTKTQTLLNDLLLVGPTIQPELYMLLLQFRLYRYAITADVTKMYRQVLLNKNDCKFQYILWRVSPDLDLQTYQLNTVTHGTASAPYLAIRSLHYLADQCMDELPIGAMAVKSSFYVDDLICGADDVATLLTLKSQVIGVLRRGQFPLSKWRSNHLDFMESQTSKKLNITDDFLTSALGVTWHQRSDALLFTFTPKQVHDSVTKRTILSIASSLFVPLGLVSPLIITPKIIMQELWLLKLNWDESVPPFASILE